MQKIEGAEAKALPRLRVAASAEQGKGDKQLGSGGARSLSYCLRSDILILTYRYFLQSGNPIPGLYICIMINGVKKAAVVYAGDEMQQRSDGIWILPWKETGKVDKLIS